MRGLNRPASGAFAVALKHVSLEVHSGEILGIAGIAGNGQDELMEALSGEWRGGEWRGGEWLGRDRGGWCFVVRRIFRASASVRGGGWAWLLCLKNATGMGQCRPMRLSEKRAPDELCAGRFGAEGRHSRRADAPAGTADCRRL